MNAPSPRTLAKQAKSAPYRQAAFNRDVKQIAASVMGLAYGPSECRREDADEYLAVKVNAGGLIAQSTLFDSQQIIPVCYGYTRNRAILETKYNLETAARL